MLAGRKPGERLLEIRSRTTHGAGMTQRYFPAASGREGAALEILERTVHVDVYVGVALRDSQNGGRRAVSDSHLLWVEIDQPDAYRHLLRAPLPPTAVVASGSSGHLHAYWQLDQPVGVGVCESGNRRLAALLAGDPASVDMARILRPPGSVNRKCEPTPVRLEFIDLDRCYDYDALVGKLTDPKAAEAARQARVSAHSTARYEGDLTDRVRSVNTAQYVEILTGQVPNIDNKIRCPFHGEGQERTPSLHCFGDGCWQCFGCGKGGTIFDFAAELFNHGTKGRDFLKLRDELARKLGISPSTRPTLRPPAATPLAISSSPRPPVALAHKPISAAPSGAER